MGTWNWGPFDNDIALDAVRQLADGSFNMDQFRFECRASPLDIEQVQVLVALSAVMNGYLPGDEFADARNFSFSFKNRRWVETKVKESIQPMGSELYQMWDDVGELNEWLAATGKAVYGSQKGT